MHEQHSDRRDNNQHAKRPKQSCAQWKRLLLRSMDASRPSLVLALRPPLQKGIHQRSHYLAKSNGALFDPVPQNS